MIKNIDYQSAILRMMDEGFSRGGPTSADYLRCTTFKRKEGRDTVSCKLGLWSVDAPSTEPGRARIEGYHYFRQYWADGEYENL